MDCSTCIPEIPDICFVYQNKIYVIGGGTGFGQNGEGVIHSSVNEVYDPSTDTWESRTSMPTKRGQMDANMVDGKIYVIGGRTAGQYSTTNLTEVYDPSTDMWTTKAAIPYPVVSYQSAVVGKRIYIIGGQDEFDSRLNLDTTQIYDTVSNTWSLGAATPTLLQEGAAAATAGVNAPKRIYVMGVSKEFAVPSKQNYVYDPQANSWNTGAPLPTARYSPAIAVVNDLLYVIGGATGWKTLGAVEEYTPFGYGTTTPEETVPPNVTVISPENQTYSMSNVSLVFAVTNRPAVWMGYSLDGQETVTLTGNITLTGLVETAHNVIVYASDIVGDTGASERVFFVVGVPPVVSVVSPSNKTYELSNVTLTFTVNESVSWISYSLDGQENSTISGNMTLAGLSGGSHRLRVYANDTYGNMGASENVSFTIRETFPTMAVVAVSGAIIIIAVAGLFVYLKKHCGRAV